MDEYTCVVASHISSPQRLEYMRSCLDSCSTYFKNVIVSVSCVPELSNEVRNVCASYRTFYADEQLSQFQHIERVSDIINTQYVIFMDDDDTFLPNTPHVVKLLTERYSMHRGVQTIYHEEEVVCTRELDFSGSICPVFVLRDFLAKESDYIQVYDCDCAFMQYIDEVGNTPARGNNYKVDHDVDSYVHKRDHDLERDWCK